MLFYKYDSIKNYVMLKKYRRNQGKCIASPKSEVGAPQLSKSNKSNFQSRPVSLSSF